MNSVLVVITSVYTSYNKYKIERKGLIFKLYHKHNFLDYGSRQARDFSISSGMNHKTSDGIPLNNYSIGGTNE